MTKEIQATSMAMREKMKLSLLKSEADMKLLRRVILKGGEVGGDGGGGNGGCGGCGSGCAVVVVRWAT